MNTLAPEAVVALLDVDASQPVFAGHFPGRPVLPGVLLLHFMRRQLQALHGPRPFSRLRRVKFLQPVRPGSRIHLACECARPPWHQCRVLAEDGTVVAQAEIALAETDA